MKTVKELKTELNKFKDSDLCYAYEGEVTGIIINRGRQQGVIYCSEKVDVAETKLIEGITTTPAGTILYPPLQLSHQVL